MQKVEFTDRYKATGTPYPGKDSCDWCEGMGYSPLEKKDLNTEACKTLKGKLIIVGQKEKNGKPTKEDNWVFVVCPECYGTRKKNVTAKQILEMLKKGFEL